jgi:hypothetical protein
MVPRQGLEPWTSALPRMRSTTELPRRRGGAYSEENRRCKAQNRLDRRSLSPHPRRMPISDDKSTREAKLAEALRTNLRKRKAAFRKDSADLDPALAAAEAAPKPYNAVRKLLGISHRDGERVEIVVELSSPFVNPEGHGWAVAVRLAGDNGQFDTDSGKAAFGRDGSGGDAQGDGPGAGRPGPCQHDPRPPLARRRAPVRPVGPDLVGEFRWGALATPLATDRTRPSHVSRAATLRPRVRGT